MSQCFRRLMIVILAFPIVPWLVAPPSTHAEEASIADHVVLRSAELDGMWAQYMAAAGHAYVTPWVVVVLPQQEAGAAGWYSENVVLAAEPVDSSWGALPPIARVARSTTSIRTRSISPTTTSCTSGATSVTSPSPSS